MWNLPGPRNGFIEPFQAIVHQLAVNTFKPRQAYKSSPIVASKGRFVHLGLPE